jgi:hypothetical protein
MTCEEVFTLGGPQHAAAGFARGIKSPLKGCSVLRLTISLGAGVEGRDDIGFLAASGQPDTRQPWEDEREELHGVGRVTEKGACGNRRPTDWN